MSSQESSLGSLQPVVVAARKRLRATGAVGRLWRRDGALWSSDGRVARSIEQRLGWLSTPHAAEEFLSPIEGFRRTLPATRRVILLGMGGSSLAPQVMVQALGGGGPPLTVLDSTSPDAVRDAEADGIEGTVFVVSSKSGTTVETRTLAAYFRERAADRAAFVAVTDPGTPLAQAGMTTPFVRAFLNPADIGGRYSALSYFGLLPAALAGVDVRRLMERTAPMVRACRHEDPDRNPGAWLGAVLGAAAGAGRDKVTLLLSPALAGLGAWIEQLLAESTGKRGTGLLPVDGEPPGEPDTYGPDRLFVSIRQTADPEPAGDRLARLAAAGHPVVRLTLEDPADLGAEFFRWEVATALAGFLMGINPFDEPNVQRSKDITNELLEAYRREGRLPEEPAALTRGGVSLSGAAGGTISAALADLLAAAVPPQYVALLAFLPRSPEYDAVLQRMRDDIHRRRRVATTRGFGPRYLHSTGQLFKGGPPTGIFLVFTATPAADLPIPGEPYTFGTLLRAQALGDIQALRSAGRPVLRIHLADPGRDLPAVGRMLSSALGT